MKCPNCGADVKEGKFCNYCGALLPDNVNRVEVKIDKRIEDVAEVKRASYEEEESKLRQKKMKQEMRKGRIKLWIILGWAVIGLILFVPVLFHPNQSMSTSEMIGMVMVVLGIIFGVVYGLHKL